MQQHPDFDSIKQLSPYGAEFWSARDLMPLLGYDRWERFDGAIKRAMKACEQVGQVVDDHFWHINKIAQIGSGASREIVDFNLTRYAFHLLIVLSDIRKPEIAQALAYFTLTSLEQHFDYSAASRSAGSVPLKPLAVTKERETINQIMRAFEHLQVVQQYKVASFRIDLYFLENKIAVECDENGHKNYQRDAEARRQAYIEQVLECKFVRYNPDSLDFNIGDVIHKIMMLVYNGKS